MFFGNFKLRIARCSSANIVIILHFYISILIHLLIEISIELIMLLAYSKYIAESFILRNPTLRFSLALSSLLIAMSIEFKICLMMNIVVVSDILSHT